MKPIVIIISVISLLLLAGCGGGDPAETQRLEEKIATLEQRIGTLEQNLQQTRLDLAAKQNQVDKLEEDLRTVATIVDKATVRLDRLDRR